MRKIRDRKAATPEAANSRVKALRQVFRWALDAGHAKANQTFSHGASWLGEFAPQLFEIAALEKLDGARGGIEESVFSGNLSAYLRTYFHDTPRDYPQKYPRDKK